MKRVAVLGSSGSIGLNTLEVIKHLPHDFKVAAISANSNTELLNRQIKEFEPEFVCVGDALLTAKIRPQGIPRSRILSGQHGLEAIAGNKGIDIIVLAISGSAALPVLIKAIDSGKRVALANKEALVMAGPIIMRRAKNKCALVIPVDSEESAIWQCLQGQDISRLKNIYLTASGGPFRDKKAGELKDISIDAVLKHPRWSMGRKISVDSASLMNKGLELLETMFLFGVPLEKIKILIHPEALVHSMVEFVDGSILAQISSADMRIPIQYALTYPQRLTNPAGVLDFYKVKKLRFEAPDYRRFPCLRLALRAASELGTIPAVLNAANEICVEGFLRKRIKFIAIPKIIEQVLDNHSNRKNPGLEDVMEADSWARREAAGLIT
jgi:1-deoxy-D-xylulose-5-phosphate reductoisomerase